MRGCLRCPLLRGVTRKPLKATRSWSAEGSKTGRYFVETPFEQLGLDGDLVKGLKGMGIDYPTTIQSLALEKLTKGKDAILAAETGSGKTLTYILPLLHRILNEKRNIADASSRSTEDASDGEIEEENPLRVRSARYAMIMCPSLDLCQQVQSMTVALLEASGIDDVTSELSPAGFSRYSRRPDLLLGTPGSIVSTLVDMRKDVAHRILEGVGYVVIDEADLILTGSYKTQIDRLFRMLTAAQRTVAMRSLTQRLSITKDAFLHLPKGIRRAGIEGGIQGMIEAGYLHSVDDSSQHPPSWLRQFIFAGATIPSEGGKNVKDDILKLVPTAEIISTRDLHTTSQRVTYDWLQIQQEKKLPTLSDILRRSFSTASSGKTLVFVRDAATVDRTSLFLTDHDIDTIPYHKQLGGELRRANLQRFRKEKDAIMICTDGMSRGMDIDDVTHVIQCDFAPSAVAFLHRVGRTGRIGRTGHVTSLMTESDRELGTVIREAVEKGMPIEGAFSRNRSFRKKLRRYGTYVPRGMTGGRVVSTTDGS